ncbi:hypothetical protein [[Kitasatospora] papulosa]|uniref:hypothetical protein n=1 Tax=[Kitasatospora] papulosa TaxID=1464011 RepID=UPI00368622B1
MIAPPTVPAGQRDRLPPDVADPLGFVGVYASEHPDQRLIWFTDVTRWRIVSGTRHVSQVDNAH